MTIYKNVNFSVRLQDAEFKCIVNNLNHDDRTAMVELSDRKGGVVKPLKVAFEDLIINHTDKDTREYAERQVRIIHTIFPSS